MCNKNMKMNIYYTLLMKMKITGQGYGAKLCLKLVLNKLKEMKGATSIYTTLGT
jgi:hypothetical protein